MNKPLLRQQIEQILDETRGNLCRVIVQMEPSDDLITYIQASANAVAERRQAITARALLPPERNMIVDQSTTKIRQLMRKSFSRNWEAFLASSVLTMLDRAELLELGAKALRPLLSSELVKKAVSVHKDGRSDSVPVHFRVASSAALTLKKDQLQQLPEEVESISAIFPDRYVRVPPVTRSADEPAAVKDNPGHTWGLGRTGAIACWGAYGVRGKGVKVAVLDTGYDHSHPDLKDKLSGFCEFDKNGNPVEGKTTIDSAYDSENHGSHVSGSIVGGNASGRWIGMAPDAKVLAGLVLKNGVGTDRQILAGIQWAIDSGADVINMSLGGLEMSPDVFDTYTLAILNANRLGIPVVVAVGNDGQGTSGAPGNDLYAFTVGATDNQDRAAGFSGGRTQIIRDSRYIDSKYLPLAFSKPELTAPGVDVYSCIRGEKWEAFSGSSMATPHVAGAMALLLSKPDKLLKEVTTTIAQLEGRQKVDVLQQLLTSTVKELGEAGQDHRFGFGRIDVLRAFGFAVELGYFGDQQRAK